MKFDLEDIQVETFEFASFRLDGGAMFGSVPKNIWSKKIASDDENCIPLAARSLFITLGSRKIIVDVGPGDSWPEKQRKIFAIDTSNARLPFKTEEITDVIITHLHFDHAAGIHRQVDGKFVHTFPNATIHVQRKNLANATQPNPREAASYFPEVVSSIKSQKLNCIDGDCEFLPGINLELVNGHTEGLQWLRISAGSTTLAFPGDLIPTAHHVNIPYVMGYDICAKTALKEKELFIKRALKDDWTIIFQHDIDTVCGKIFRNDAGKIEVNPLP